MKKLVGLLLLTAFVAAFCVGYLATSSPASADPSSCTTTCDPVKCPLKCQAAGFEGGGCVKTGPHCFKCQCIPFS